MTRGRYKVVCSFCRKRKIKCDKKSPCTACVKMGNPHCDAMPRPDSSPVDAADALRYRIAVLEQQISSFGVKPAVNLEEASQIETINFHDAISRLDHHNDQSWMYVGPFKFVVMVSIDETLLNIFKSFYECKDRVSFAGATPRFYVNALDKDIGLFHKPQGNEVNKTLRTQINEILPDLRAIYMLIDRFFLIVYPYLPIFNEDEFRQSVARLIGGRMEGNHRPITGGSDDADPAILGLLLVVLRLSYITLTSGANKVPTFCFHNSKEELDYLIKQHIGTEFIDLANQCLSVYNVTGDIRFEALQLITALRIYSTVGPELTRFDARSITLASLLNQMAYGLWLNRERRHERPDFKKKHDTLKKKIWYTLLHLEVEQSLFSGNLMAIGPDTFDVSLPTFDMLLLNGCNIESEQMAIENLHWLEGYRKLFTEVIALTGKVSGNVRLDVLDHKIAALERCYEEVLEELKQLRLTPSLTIKDSFLRFTRLKLMLSQHYFIVGIYSHLINYYLKKGDYARSSLYKLRVVGKMSSFLFPLLPKLVQSSMTILSGSTDLFICGPLVQCLSQCSLFIVAAIVRYRKILQGLERQVSHTLLFDPASEYNVVYIEVKKHLTLLGRSNQIVLNVYDLMKPKYESAKRFSLLTKKVTDSLLLPDFSAEERIIRPDDPEVSNLKRCNALTEECLMEADIASLIEDYGDILGTDSTTSEIPTELLWESGSLSPFGKYFDIIPIEEMTRIL